MSLRTEYNLGERLKVYEQDNKPHRKTGDQYADCNVTYTRKSTDDSDNQRTPLSIKLGLPWNTRIVKHSHWRRSSWKASSKVASSKNTTRALKEDDYFTSNSDGVLFAEYKCRIPFILLFKTI